MLKKNKNLKFTQNNIAIVYDFDGTLSPGSMQEYTILPQLKIKPEKFWAEVAKEAKETLAEPMLVYLRKILEEAEKRNIQIKREDYQELAKNIKYFPGVDNWFLKINDFIKQNSEEVNIYHYIISAGMKEILEGISIKDYFRQIYASEYYYNHVNKATFPKILINDTIKTQFLFRINKGKENISESINQHTSQKDRPIPFENILYIGDGLTDVPCMAVTKQNRGHAIAVYNSKDKKGQEVCAELLADNRVDFIAKADYREGKDLDKKVQSILRLILAKIECAREQFKGN